jgi:hypothetical protein
MGVKKAVGRPSKLNYRTMFKLADSIQHNYSISDACGFAKISRDSYYRYLKTEPMFREHMERAHNNRNKVSFSFRTLA